MRQQVHFDRLDDDEDFEGSANMLLGEINWDEVMEVNDFSKLENKNLSTEGFYWKGKYTPASEFILPETNSSDEIPVGQKETVHRAS